MELQPCLELYGDDPDLRDSLKDFYGNSDNRSSTGWQCMKPD